MKFLKYFCDKCGKELRDRFSDEEVVTEFFEFSLVSGFSLLDKNIPKWYPEEYHSIHLCKKCYLEFYRWVGNWTKKRLKKAEKKLDETIKEKIRERKE